jgi:hypothetical protein
VNDMELLRELAGQTPLPAPGELDAARARLMEAIEAGPAASATDMPAQAPAGPAQATGEPAGPSRPPAPEPVLAAVRLMYGGAVGTAVQLVIALFYAADIKAYHLTVLGHHLSTAQLSHFRPLIVTLTIAFALVVIALWLWAARAAGQGRSLARIMSTVLAGLATFELGGNPGAVPFFFAALTWLTGVCAVWLLWRPTSTAFFRRCQRAALTRDP